MLRRAALVLSVLLVVGALAGCSSKAVDVSRGSGAEASASASQAAPDYSNMKVGDTVKLSNGLEITVNEFEVFTPQYSDKPATRVFVTYVNNGKDKQSFNLFDWKAEDTNGAETSSTIVFGSENELQSGDLRAGGTVAGNIYFDGDNIIKVRYYDNMFQSDSEICWVLG